MKNNLFYLLTLCLLMSACSKDDSETPADGLSNNIHNLLSANNLKALNSLGLPINEGNTPPSFENIYFCSPMVLKGSTVEDDEIGMSFNDFKIKFYDQDNEHLTIKGQYVGINETGSGSGSFISGKNNSFTVFSQMDITIDGETAFGAIVLSAKLTNNGLNDCHIAVLMIDDYGDSEDVFIENNTGRLIYDKDGFSEVINSLKEGKLGDNSLDVSKLFRSN